MLTPSIHKPASVIVRISARLSRPLFGVLLFLLAGAAGNADETFYVAPNGSPANSGASGSPIDWLTAFNKINALPVGNGVVDPNLILRFAPGTYELVPTHPVYKVGLLRSNNYRKRIAILGDTPCRSESPIIFKWKDNVHPDPGSDDRWQEAQMISLNGVNQDPTMERIVIANIVFDGNFDKQTQVVGPHFREGYKSLAVVAAAKSGRVRNCMIRNFGAQGFMPGSSGIASGVETFQLLITATDPEPAATGQIWPDPLGTNPDSHNWIIEDNEVSNLHFAYGGYCTAIVLNAVGTGDWKIADPSIDPAPSDSTRIGVVRRNTIRGRFGDRMPIALGAAHNSGPWIGRVTFSDNVVLNADLGFNTDTGVLRELDFLHNMFLDVGTVGNCGQAVSDNPFQSYYTIKDNCVRLRGRAGQKNYSDYKDFSTGPVSDPALDLWRPLTFPATGLTVQGRVASLTMSNNRFTTWRTSTSGDSTVGPDLFLSVPSPLATGNGTVDGWWNPVPTWEGATCNWWSFLVPYENNKYYTEASFARYRNNATKVTLSGNVASSMPFYFTAGATFSDFGPNNAVVIPSLTQGVSPTSSLEHTKMRPPLAATQFKPVGFIGRVAPVFKADSAHPSDHQYSQLQGVAEVAISEVNLDPASHVLTVRARVAEHRAVGVGIFQTYVWRNTISQLVKFQLVGADQIPGAWPASSTTQTYLGLDENGFVSFQVDLDGIEGAGPLPNGGLLVPRVWMEGGEDYGGIGGPNPNLDNAETVAIPPATPVAQPTAGTEETSGLSWEEERDAWAEARLVYQLPGQNVVQLYTQPDVANEKSGKRAKLIFTRTGSKVAPLAVRVSIPVNTLAGTPFIRRGTYGASGAADYYFDWSSATYLASVPDALNRPVTGSTGMVSILPTEPTAGQPTDGYVVFPANSDRVIVDVVARADEVFERETAYVRIEASPVSFYSGGSQYGSTTVRL